MSGIAWHGPALTVRVLGIPVGQGRITTFGKGRTTHSNAKTLLPWREQVQHGAELEIERAYADIFPLAGPVNLHAYFTVAKPKSAPKRKTTWPVTRPDLSHLVRAVEDALTNAGVWGDDSQVVQTISRKVYPAEGDYALHVPGVILRIYTGSEAPDA